MSVTTPTSVEVAAALEIVMRENAIDAGEAARVIQAHAQANDIAFVELANEIVRVDRCRHRAS